jgi:hypothetical protein
MTPPLWKSRKSQYAIRKDRLRRGSRTFAHACIYTRETPAGSALAML